MCKISIAPMIKVTNRHFRYLMRLITKRALFYTEMISDNAIVNTKNLDKLVGFSDFEKPLCFQIGSSNQKTLQKAILALQNYSYDEYNLNCGCPSEKVRYNDFGAILMNDADKVADLLNTISDNTSKPVSIKHRIGISGFGIDKTNYQNLYDFVDKIHQKTNIKKFIIHARVAILEGLSPDDNRKIPPLRYEDVYKIKRDFPQLHIEINGNIKSYDEVNQHLKYTDGVMLGRIARDDPYFFAKIDKLFFNESKISCRYQITKDYISYLKQRDENSRVALIPLIQLFKGQKGAKIFKSELSKKIEGPLYSFLEKAYKKSNLNKEI